MKKTLLLFFALAMTLTASAQFEKGKKYVAASLSSLELSSQAKQFHFSVEARAGYLMADNLMLLGEVGYNHIEDTPDQYSLGAMGRYYIVQNGLYLGAGLKYKHSEGYNDLLPGVQLGYAFFVSKTVTIEPELYMDFSTKKFDYSCYGLRIGFGIYL